jgi:hypothetical protein
MSWSTVYRLCLRLLPAGLRRKHGVAMQELFAREMERARTRGHAARALVGVAAIFDVARRGIYERLRPVRVAPNDHLAVVQPACADDDVNVMAPGIAIAQLRRRLAVAFATAFTGLTGVLLAHFAYRQAPTLFSRGASVPDVARMLLYAIPFIVALTIPMAVLIAVLRVVARLRAQGMLAAVRGGRGAGPLVATVLRGALGVSVVALAITAEVVPRANARLAPALAGRPMLPNDRTMTIGQLRQAARSVRASPMRQVAAQATAYEVEVQKKLALPAACLVLALVGLAVGLRAPTGSLFLVIGASVTVLGTYYMLLVAGEGLADLSLVSPFIAMWSANALLTAAALAALRPSRPSIAPSGGGAIAAGR